MPRLTHIILFLGLGAAALGGWLFTHSRTPTSNVTRSVRAAAVDQPVGLGAELKPRTGGDPQAPRVRLSLRCLAAGAPVSGVQVVALLRADNSWKQVEVGLTDATGQLEWALPPGPYGLVADSPSLAREVLEIELLPGGDKTLDLVLSSGHALEGLVVDARSREPIVGALLAVRGSATALQPAASTDARGGFRLAGLPAGRIVVEATAPGFAAKSVVARLPDPSPLHIVLTSAAWLSGRVLGPVGTVEARVMATGAADGEVRETTAATSGAFSLEVPAGRYAVVARSASGVSNVVHATVLPGETAPGLELRIGPGAWIRGAVRRSGDRKAVSGATVVLSVVDRDAKVLENVSGAAGEFVLGPIPRGTFDLSAHVTGHVPTRVPALEVPAEGNLSTDLFVSPGASVAVKVRREDGKALVSARVSLAYSGFVADATLPSGSTDEHGAVTLSGLPAGPLMLLVQSTERGLTTRVPVVVPPTGTVHQQVTLPDAPTLVRGQVSGGSRPLATAPIIVKFRRDTPSSWGERLAEADGRFVLELPRGPWRLAATQGERKTNVVALDLSKTQGPVELALEDPPARPHVCVRDPSDKPTPGARVFYRSASARGMSTTDGAGCTALGPFDDEVVSIAAELESMRGVATLHSNQDATVQLQPAGVVRGTASADQPVRSFVLSIPTDPDMQPSGVSRTIIGSQFVLEVPVGAWTLTARSDDGLEATAQVDVRPQDETRVDLHFSPSPRPSDEGSQ